MLVIIFCIYPMLLKYSDIYVNVLSLPISFISLSVLMNNTPRLCYVFEHIYGIDKGVWRGILGIHLGIFLYGIVLRVRNRVRTAAVSSPFLICISIIQVFLIEQALQYVTVYNTGSYDYYFIPLIWIILMITFSYDTFLEKVLSKLKFIPFLGKISLYMYLLQSPVNTFFYVFRHKVGGNVVIACMIYICITLMISVVLYEIQKYASKMMARRENQIQ